MRGIRLFAKGRLLPIVPLLVIADMLLSFKYWDARYPLYISGQGMPVYIIVPALIGQACATLCLVCIAPRTPVTDRLAVRKTAIWNVGAAIATAGIHIAIPLVNYQILASIPTATVPNYKTYITGGARFTDVVPLNNAIFTSASIAIHIAVATCAISLLGKITGTLVSFACLTASVGALALMPYDALLRGNISGADTGVAIYACIAAVACAASLAVWGVSRAAGPFNPMNR